MTPNYNLCDKCKTEKVQQSNRVQIHDGWDDLGEIQYLVFDICPKCMARLVRAHITPQAYRDWENTGR